MLNHFRTLLVNLDGDDTFTPYLGEEIIPSYHALSNLPGYITAVRAVLFGKNPDRYMLNYRVRQLLALVHASPLVEYVLALDSRITYSLDSNDWSDSVCEPQVLQTAGTEADMLSILGTPAIPDVTGMTANSFDIQGLDDLTVRVSRLTAPIRSQTYAYNIASGLSDTIPLSGSGYSVRFSTNNPGQHWRVWVFNRPQRDLASISSSLEQIGAANIDQLFGAALVEPYKTFSNLWFGKRELPLKLGALVCALVYRMEERRLAGA